MRAAGFETFGPPEVLRLLELPEPHAGPGEVRVRVKAAGVMPFDCLVRGDRLPQGVQIRMPQVPGNEFAGVVDRIGEGVNGFAEGEEVLGFSLLQAYAEYLVVRPEQIVRKPAGMPWEVAGGFSGNGQGAQMAMEMLRIGPGDAVLIHAAAGGLGTFSVQLARERGASLVIGTASPGNHEYLRSLGAVPVAYGEGLADRVRAIAPGGVDAVLDAAGGAALRDSLELVRDKDRMTTFTAFELARELGVPLVRGERTAERLWQLVDLYDRGNIRIHIRSVYGLDQAAHAHAEVESGHGRGKVVIVMGVPKTICGACSDSAKIS